ncbi:hypothetical protein MNBD_BACTEROID03-2603 [hydrothermal vent metagenome]|uniref:Uncharacterized protein n=1 Tax=hydrothermal vent metagenome TaxID=652676 RepID=A0A3B0THC7_9ZZZZ
MYKPLIYLKHMATATNQHGVHSPFVYDYLTKCLYKKTKAKTPKIKSVLLKSIPYFSMENIIVISDNQETTLKIQKESNLKSEQNPPFDLIYADKPSVKLISLLEEKENSVHNGSMVLIDRIYQTEDLQKIWKDLTQLKKVTVSIDMFYCGALFFRKEQDNEDFKIRI